MSDILIRGMEMPKSCDECRRIINCCESAFDGTLWCRLAHGYIGDKSTICPILPVPPHGRLINAGYVYAGIEMRLAKFVEEGRTTHSQQYELGYWRGIEDAKAALSNTPTIIPASEEGE